MRPIVYFSRGYFTGELDSFTHDWMKRFYVLLPERPHIHKTEKQVKPTIWNPTIFSEWITVENQRRCDTNKLLQIMNLKCCRLYIKRVIDGILNTLTIKGGKGVERVLLGKVASSESQHLLFSLKPLCFVYTVLLLFSRYRWHMVPVQISTSDSYTLYYDKICKVPLRTVVVVVD